MTTFKEQLALDMANILGNQDELGESHQIDSTENIPCVLETVSAKPSEFDVGYQITKCLTIQVSVFPGGLFLGRYLSIDGVSYTIVDFKSYAAHHEIYLSRYQG